MEVNSGGQAHVPGAERQGFWVKGVESGIEGFHDGIEDKFRAHETSADGKG